MNIAVVGAGHGGCAAAAAYALRGHRVGLCKLGTTSHEDNFQAIASRGSIRLRGIQGEGDAPLVCVTRRPEEVLADVDLVLVFYVANFHEQAAERLTPHLRDGMVVVLGPGYAGSLLFEQAMRKRRAPARVVFAELETLPFSSRIQSPGIVEISSQNVRHPIATLPASRTAEAIDRLSPLLGSCVAKANVLEVALHNPNLIIHTIGTLMNVAMIERQGAGFHLYRDGFSESVWRLVHRLDEEKMAVMSRVGGRPTTYFQEFVLRTFEDLSTDPMAGFLHYAGEAPGGPSTIWTRYITEDVPVGLGLLHSLGRHAGVETPTADMLVRLASAIHQRDYAAEARTVERLSAGGWDSLLEAVGGS